MALSDERIRLYVHRLLLSRMRIMCSHSFYGLLLMHMRFAVDEAVETAQTDGERIVFGTEFLEKLTDSELDFVMLHEIMHVVLQHCLRTGDRDNELFNIACDIVVNSNILLENRMDLKSITLKEYGESMHLAPDKKEGYEYTAEQVYEMLLKKGKKKNGKGSKSGSGDKGKESESKSTDTKTQNGKSGAASQNAKDANDTYSVKDGDSAKATSQNDAGDNAGEISTWDDHSKWGTAKEEPELLRDVWVSRVQNAASAIEIRDPGNQRGTLPLLAQRMLEELKKPTVDWRTVLSEFIHEEIVDYSFSPPDRRFDDTPFYLPDFNETEEEIKNILFMIDTSASMSDSMITRAYSEVKGAIDQFNGKLKGWLGFFDGTVAEPTPFENEEEFRIIKPKGGGGTDFHVIFKYVNDKMQEEPPVSIIILTDGYAPFPDENAARGIPVLWLINNEAVTPPWGKIARIE